MKSLVRITFALALVVSLIGLPITAVNHLIDGEYAIAILELFVLAAFGSGVYFDTGVKTMLIAEYFNLIVTFEGLKAKYRARG